MDPLSPARTPAAADAEEAKPRIAPKADPVPPSAATASDTAAKPTWRTRLMMFGLPALMLAAGGWYWLSSGGGGGAHKSHVQKGKGFGAPGRRG
ncbi:MAG TPA: HlyD family secretion protein, partial [Sphingopyxis sp.]|nr:HlyD family secretion protein [Sphingopyxis sp.]